MIFEKKTVVGVPFIDTARDVSRHTMSEYVIICPMRVLLSAFLIFVLLVQPSFGMSSSNYQIHWDSVNTGGDDFAASESYQLNDTVGELVSGTSTGALYATKAGYRGAEATLEALSLTLGAQESETRVTYTTFSAAGKTVTVSSAGYLSAGDYIAVVEYGGFAPLLAIGRVQSIAGSVVTVDAWSGDQASMNASVTGGDDYVYRLGGASIGFGTLTPESVGTAIASASVASTADNGYTLYIQADGDLRTSSASITPVTDGAVTLGSEEYGMEVVGTYAYGAGTDLAVSSTQRIIQQSSAPSAAGGDRIGMIFKLATLSATTAGSYTQTVYYTLTANY